MLVRLDKIQGYDLNVFDFDYDLTWAAFFLRADEAVYGRYGTRDARSADDRLSLAGLRHAMAAALEAHERGDVVAPARKPPLRVEDYPAAQGRKRNDCIHCHQVYEYRRAAAMKDGSWKREERWIYPLPENVGITLERDRGDRIAAVSADSSAARLGLRPGDQLRRAGGLAVASSADLQYALHRAPVQGTIEIVWTRNGREEKGKIALGAGWRKTNLTWRPSMLDLLPSIGVHGSDLTGGQKEALGLSAKQLAFRQGKPIPEDVRRAGIREGDVIVGLDGRTPEMTVEAFLAHVRRNYLAGDTVRVGVLREGQRVELPLVLP